MKLADALTHLSDRSVGGADALKIEEMEKMLREAQLEKARLIESRVRRIVRVQTSMRTVNEDGPVSTFLVL